MNTRVKVKGLEIRSCALLTESARYQCEQLCIENTCALENHVPSGESLCPRGVVYSTTFLSRGVNCCLEIVTQMFVSWDHFYASIFYSNYWKCKPRLVPFTLSLLSCGPLGNWYFPWALLSPSISVEFIDLKIGKYLETKKKKDEIQVPSSVQIYFSDSSFTAPPPTNAVVEGSLGPQQALKQHKMNR